MLKGESIALACVFQSHNSILDNSNNINKSLEISSNFFSSNLLVEGNFTYSEIDWDHYSTASTNNLNFKFSKCPRVLFFEKFILEATRG